MDMIYIMSLSFLLNFIKKIKFTNRRNRNKDIYFCLFTKYPLFIYLLFKKKGKYLNAVDTNCCPYCLATDNRRGCRISGSGSDNAATMGEKEMKVVDLYKRSGFSLYLHKHWKISSGM